jgi:hypothetical protein
MSALADAWRSVPKPVRFGLSGSLGNLFLLGFYQLLLWGSAAVALADNPFRASVCWALAYGIAIPVFNILHSELVFGRPESYYVTLPAAYASYGGAAAVSLFITFTLSNGTSLSAGLIGVVTLITTGILNYITVSKAHEKKT